MIIFKGGNIILPLEQQVCTLESAKRLKDPGFPQKSLFYWRPIPPDYKLSYCEEDKIEECDYSAYLKENKLIGE